MKQSPKKGGTNDLSRNIKARACVSARAFIYNPTRQGYSVRSGQLTAEWPPIRPLKEAVLYIPHVSERRLHFYYTPQQGSSQALHREIDSLPASRSKEVISMASIKWD